MTAILKVDTIQDTAGNNIINESSNTITIGASGDTIALAGTTVTGITQGITEADQWRLTANLAGNNFITSNLERSDTYGAGYIGTGMSQSSGVFTFPSTGIWKVEFNPNYRLNGDTRVIEAKIYTTPDNSTYNVAAFANTFIQQTESNETAASTYLQINFDVTNTSNDKVKFYSEYTNQSTLMKGSTSGNWTTMTFTRLGDT
tara:strand:+ start:473 stop:1078 length:606 start_codon:yes stop_codon:yes gene_type:complete